MRYSFFFSYLLHESDKDSLVIPVLITVRKTTGRE